jgi:titin
VYEDRLLLTTFLVTNTSDSATPGSGSLRRAILDANADPAAPHVIDFNIGTGPQTIRPGSALPTISRPTTIDGTTQPGLPPHPRIILDGVNAGAGVDGLTISAGSSAVLGLEIIRFRTGATLLSGGNNTIAGNYIGTDGFGALPNSVYGVAVVNGSANNTIGGLTAAARNVISGNGSNAIAIFGSADVANNVVEGNYIGTDYRGEFAVGNGAGIAITDAANHNTIGGTAPGARNVIAANRGAGIGIFRNSGTTANVVQGNYIGTDARGISKLANTGPGVLISDAANNNAIGGTDASARNVIAGNGANGVQISGSGTTGNLVQGNFIGTTAAGDAPLGNAFSGVGISGGASSNTVGGTDPGARNVLSGNANRGVAIFGAGVMGNVVQGNYIGTDTTGTTAVPNTWEGVAIGTAAANNTVGGTDPGAGNVIAGNLLAGVGLFGDATNGGPSANVIQGNYIGTDSSGTVALGNGSGVSLSDLANHNTVGGTTAAARNIIAANQGDGVAIFRDARTTGNVVQGNYIGTDVSGTLALPNFRGVSITNDVVGNTLGGTDPGAGNLISGNSQEGVIFFNSSNGNTVQGNTIGLDANGGPLGNLQSGVALSGPMTSNNLIGGTDPGAGNTIGFNGYDGVVVDAGTGNAIQQNLIFSSNRLGIELVNNGNHNQAFPVITSASYDGTNTVIGGSLHSSANGSFMVELFANTVCNPSGFGEGQTDLGSVLVMTDGSGNGSFTAMLPSADTTGQFIAATATNSSTNDTSQFSACVVVPTPNSPGPPRWARAAYPQTFDPMGASLISQFFAYDLNFKVGTTVGAADIENNGHADILTGAAAGSPHFRVVRGDATSVEPPAVNGIEGLPIDLQGGVSVGASLPIPGGQSAGTLSLPQEGILSAPLI